MKNAPKKLINIFTLTIMLFYFMPSYNDVSASYKSTPLFASSDLIWANRMGGTYYKSGETITTDANGQIYLSGVFKGTSDFDPSAGIVNLTSAGDNSSPFNSTFDVYISKLEANGDFIWAKRIGGINHEASKGIVTDGAGNVYITGSFTETADFDPEAEISEITSFGERDIFIIKLDTNGNLVWVKSFGDTNYDEGMDITIDENNDIYVTGRFTGTVDFDPSSNIFNLSSTGSSVDIFILKLNSNGSLVWAKKVGGSGDDYGNAISLDTNGDVISTGKFQLTADFDPGTGTHNLVSAGNDEIFILKLNGNGDFIFAKQLGGTGSEESYDVTIDSANSILTTGFIYTGIPDFDPSINTYNLISQGFFDVFISKLDSNGNFVWAKSVGGSNVEEGYSITVDNQDNVYTTGHFLSDTVDFDPGSEVYNLSNSGCSDIFISKLNSNGDFVFANNISGTDCERGKSITLDALNHVYVTGFFSGMVDFNPNIATQYITSHEASTDIFVVNLQINGDSPSISSITRASPSPTSTSSVDFTVTFSEPVTGVDVDGSDFQLFTSGVTNASITGASGTGRTYTVSVSSGSGNGTIRLDMPVTATITDLASNPVSGLPYADGEVYTITKIISSTFGDVPSNHPYLTDIEILYANGLTAGCSSSPLLFCPDTVMDRAQSAVFMLRGNLGVNYAPPNPPFGSTFGDYWGPGPWAQKWAQGMLQQGLTAGCSSSPLLYCPWEAMPRLQAAVFGMRLMNGNAYVPPPATGTVFADLTDTSLWYTKWAEQAYLNGLLPACGSSGGKPLFCPNDLVSRGLGAYMIVRAKNLSMP